MQSKQNSLSYTNWHQRQNPVVLFAFCSSVRNLLEVVPDRKLVSSLQTCVLFPVLCEDPGDRPFSTYHIPSNAFLSGKYLPGSEATYTCDECYTGGRTITCENGTWIGMNDVSCTSKTPVVREIDILFCTSIAIMRNSCTLTGTDTKNTLTCFFV